MDRRSWLWRRRTSEKSTGGETESSGSISSHSERLSDEQACAFHNAQSPEITSKVAAIDEEANDNIKTLNEKLSAALSNISAKEELVKQHAKVAEEAVTGWEKAEKEVSTLKQQLEAATKKNLALDDRVGHLNGALKECVRQLRQAREQHEQKVQEAVATSSQEWESKKSELQRQIVDLHDRLETAKVEADAQDSDLQLKLDAVQKENASLRLEIHSLSEELEVRTLERELSTQTAEAASKHHLESIKRIAKLEAELRSLKNAARKGSPINDYTSFTASSAYVDSLTDSHSDSGERLMGLDSHSDYWASAPKCKTSPRKKFIVPSSEISLMDDFLEMERLAALSETEQRRCLLDKAESTLKVELEAMISRVAHLEERLEKTEAEKMELEMALTECRQQLEASQNRCKDAEDKLIELQTQLAECVDELKASQGEFKDANIKLAELQCQLASVAETKQAVEGELEATNAKRQEAESLLKAMLAKVNSLEDEADKERALSAEAAAKCSKLEDELCRMKREADHRRAASSNGELKIQQEKDLAVAASKLADCQKTIASLGRQLKSLATLEDFLIDLDKPIEAA